MKKLLVSALLIGSSLLVSVAAFAASQGSEGTTSSGTSDISVTVPKLVKIIGIADLSQTVTGSGGFDQNDNVCVYSNMDTGSGTYSVTISGSNNPKATSPTSGYFVGNAGTDQEIAYRVYWNDVTGTGGGETTHGVALGTQNGFTNSATCAASNANFQVTMDNAALLALRPATYTGRITILITPE